MHRRAGGRRRRLGQFRYHARPEYDEKQKNLHLPLAEIFRWPQACRYHRQCTIVIEKLSAGDTEMPLRAGHRISLPLSIIQASMVRRTIVAVVSQQARWAKIASARVVHARPNGVTTCRVHFFKASGRIVSQSSLASLDFQGK